MIVCNAHYLFGISENCMYTFLDWFASNTFTFNKKLMWLLF